MSRGVAIALIVAGMVLSLVSSLPLIEREASMGLGAAAIALLALGAAVAGAAREDAAPGPQPDERPNGHVPRAAAMRRGDQRR